MRRRTLLAGAAACCTGARAQGPREAVLVTPGPASAVSLIPELARATGADAAEGLALRLKFVPGGGVAIREIADGNAEFGVFGLTAAMNENLRADRFVALAAIENRALLALMVRSDLRGSVQRIEDLRGRTLGIHSNSLDTMTNGQQFLVLLLRRHGVPPDAVRFVAAGQTWQTQASLLRGHLVDALVSEEPFATRHEREGLAFALSRIGAGDGGGTLPGEGFLRGTLLALRSRVEADPDLAARAVRTVQRTLAWRRAHSPQQIVAALRLEGDEAAALQGMLERHPGHYSADGRLSAGQLAQTETFFRESTGNAAQALRYRVESMLVDRWVGRKP